MSKYRSVLRSLQAEAKRRGIASKSVWVWVPIEHHHDTDFWEAKLKERSADVIFHIIWGDEPLRGYYRNKKTGDVEIEGCYVEEGDKSKTYHLSYEDFFVGLDLAMQAHIRAGLFEDPFLDDWDRYIESIRAFMNDVADSLQPERKQAFTNRYDWTTRIARKEYEASPGPVEDLRYIPQIQEPEIEASEVLEAARPQPPTSDEPEWKKAGFESFDEWLEEICEVVEWS